MKHNHFHSRLYRTPDTGMTPSADAGWQYPTYESALTAGHYAYVGSGSTQSEGMWVGGSGTYEVTWLTAAVAYQGSTSPYFRTAYSEG